MKKIFSILVFLCLLTNLLWAAEPIVKKIEIRGLKRIDEFSVRQKISQKIAVPLNPEKISDDIKKIFAMGYFDDVRVEMKFFEGGITLIYSLKEKPVITRISFYGNKEFDDDKLREQITLSRGSIADNTLIQDNALHLKAFYQSKGYWLAEVIPVVRKVRGSNAVVSFLIKEGSKVRIDKIDIEGNHAFDDNDITGVMKTSEWWLFSFLTSGGYYNSGVMKQDIRKIKDLYFNNGYLDVRVSDPEIKVDNKKHEMTIKINISEGHQYTVSSVSIEGNKAYKTDELRKLIKLKKGEVFSKKILSGDIKAINDFYSQKGYAMISIDPAVVPLKNSDKVKVIYHIMEGDLFHIGRIEISGNTKTEDKVIRREIRFDEGDLFNSALLKRSYQRLRNLDFFDTVHLQPRPRARKKLLDLDVSVKEKSTGSLSVGGGYSTTDRFMGMVDYSQANLFGTGRYLKLSGEFGSKSTLYQLSYRDPWFLDKPLSMTLSLYKTSRQYYNYSRKATGFGLGFGKPFSEYWRADVSYNFEDVTIYDVNATASTTIKDQEGKSTTSSISPSIVRDSRDYYLDPHEGSRNGIYLKYAGLGGENKYFKALLDSGWFFPLGPTTFSVRGRFGYATGLFGKQLPLYERYYVGGINTVRGLGSGEAGPRDANGDVIGGEKEIIFNFEYIFPLIPDIKLKGLLFFDAGKAYAQSEAINSLRRSAGFGIRWISPVGPLRLEWGYNLDKRDDENQSKFEFTFGTFF
ncbi:outer membrane protein assembly factor BamA precursor [bacterium BMS3Abin07]|nr:outer membrane protein assembly factor BamA precursor [bacterium BMS3Abin07]GBE31821.1 outer membrane protein assembly factor BamA precursor [bacterium BMS3Bbin05]